MLAAQRWALRLSRPAPRFVRTVSTRGSPDRFRKPVPPPVTPRVSRSAARGGDGAGPSTQPENKVDATSNALREASTSENNSLLAPVHVPEDRYGILKETHPATSILANSSIVVQRQLEMMNVFLGFEQANKYIIMDGEGNHVGYLAEQEHGMGNAIARQAFRTHRSFTTHVFDREQKEVLRFHRPFSWISSRIRVYDALTRENSTLSSPSAALSSLSLTQAAGPASAQISPLPVSEMRIIGEAQQQWAPLRRRYNVFLHRPADYEEAVADTKAPRLAAGDLPLSTSTALQPTNAAEDKREAGMFQFATVNEPFLSWDFSLLSADGRLIGSVNRNFAGFAREIFTDTGVYALRMDAAGLAAEPRHLISQTGAKDTSADAHATPGMTLDQRAMMLATAVSIDFDYFSRHSNAGPGWLPFPIWMGGGGAAGEAGAAGAGAAGAGAAGAGEVGVASEAGSAIGGAARGAGAAGMSESAVAGAGTMAAYEMMHGDRGESRMPPAAGEAANPDLHETTWLEQGPSSGGQGNDPWGGGPSGGGSSGGVQGGSGGVGDGGSDGGEGGGGVIESITDSISDFFDV